MGTNDCYEMLIPECKSFLTLQLYRSHVVVVNIYGEFAQQREQISKNKNLYL